MTMKVINRRNLQNEIINNQRDHNHVNNEAHEYKAVEHFFLGRFHEEKAISGR